MSKKLKPKKRIPRVKLSPRIHEPGSKPIVILDGMNLAHAAYHSYSRLSYKGQSVSMIFGLPSMIKSLLLKNQWNTEKLVVAWDGQRSQKRLEWLPEYKSHRDSNRDPKDREKFFKQIEKVKLILNYLGICQAYDEELEGDDIITLLTKKYVKLSRVIIVSGDKDMLQLVDTHVTVYNQRKDTLCTPALFSSMVYGIRLDQYIDFLCLVGDTSDDIPGIAGVGEIRAAKFLSMWPSVYHFLDSEDATFTGMMNSKKVLKIYKRNRKMIDLKWYIRKYFKRHKVKYFKDKSNPLFNDEKFTRFCLKYNLKTFLMDGFKNFFKNL